MDFFRKWSFFFFFISEWFSFRIGLLCFHLFSTFIRNFKFVNTKCQLEAFTVIKNLYIDKVKGTFMCVRERERVAMWCSHSSSSYWGPSSLYHTHTRESFFLRLQLPIFTCFILFLFPFLWWFHLSMFSLLEFWQDSTQVTVTKLFWFIWANDTPCIFSNHMMCRRSSLQMFQLIIVFIFILSSSSQIHSY